MKKFKQFTVIGLLLTAIFTGCKKEDPIVLDEPVPTEIPTDPTALRIFELNGEYQSNIIYRWDRRFFGTEQIVAPPKFENVLPYIDFMEKVWVKPYEFQVNGFMRENMPREIILVGTTIKYDEGGESGFDAAGQAISASRIILTDLNNFKWSDAYWLTSAGGSKPWMKEQAKTMHHEFAHILDKKYGRPKGFDNISKGLYAGSTSFRSFSTEVARSRGFWIPYGMSNEEEDFATFVEGILSVPKTEYLAAIKGNAKLEQKYALVFQYYYKMGIDVHTLQEQISQAITGYQFVN